MATYFHGSDSEIQTSPPPDGFHKLYLLNPATTSAAAAYVPYSDAGAVQAPTSNFLLLNPNSPNLASLSHAPPPSSANHGLVGLGSDDPTRPSFLGHEISGFHGFTAAAEAPRVHYNLWGSMIDHQSPSAAASSSSGGAPSADAMSQHMGFRRPCQQGLSLSLSSQQQTAYNRSLSGELDPPGQPRGGGGDVRILGNHIPSSTTSFSNGISSMQSFVLGSKYLKAAQELLDEVVNVGKGIHRDDCTERNDHKDKTKLHRESISSAIPEASSGGVGGGGDLSTAQRQELQMKKSKLISMLDEVEQRYRQYYHQMQIVISSFEQAAGYGAARTYTALALKTISKQFRCLKDTIASQVKATSKSLGEEDCLGGKVEGSRLRYVDHHLRQQRALQQLGMMQHNAWRPQRGLPERAVSILRAWLFEHFLHPYPKDSDKVMLAKQTGLTRSQVSNWFINARVRLWKPMVEEMYVEEMKEQEGQENNNNTKEAGNEVVGSTTKDSSSQPQDHHHHHHHQIKAFQSNNNNIPPDQSFPNHKTSPSHLSNPSMYMEMEMKPAGDTTDGGAGGGGGGYLEDIGRYNVQADQLAAPRFHGNAVSLTLGLPHSNNTTENLPHAFLSHNMNLGNDHGGDHFCGMNSTTPPSHSATTYDSIDINIQNRKRFAAQLLPDFVA